MSVSEADDPPNDLGMIARNPKNYADKWRVAKRYFEDRFELLVQNSNLHADVLQLEAQNHQALKVSVSR